MTQARIGRRDALRWAGALGAMGLGLSAGSMFAPSRAKAATGKWTSLAPMPIAQCEGTAVVLGGRIYVMGGWTDLPKPLPLVQIYDPQSNTWSQGAPLPAPRHHLGAAVVGGKIYVVGGYQLPNRQRKAVDNVWMFDPQTEKWIARAPLPEPRGALIVRAISNLIYAVGGEVSRRPGTTPPERGANESAESQRARQHYQSVPDVTVYDPEANQWKSLPPMRVARDHAYGGVIDGKLYIAGGRERPKLDINALEEFDPKTGVWRDRAPMPTGRSGGNAGVIGGRLYTFGGEGNQNSPSGVYDNVESYDPSANEWTRFDPMPHPRHSLEAAVLASKIYLIGGVSHQGGDVSAEPLVEVFEPS